jgi:hypothetical protein
MHLCQIACDLPRNVLQAICARFNDRMPDALYIFTSFFDRPEFGTIMESQSCLPYRGFTVDVRVKRSPTLAGLRSRYSVSWVVLGSAPLSTAVASLPESVTFVSADAAFLYAERQAHRFIDRHSDDPADDTTAT